MREMSTEPIGSRSPATFPAPPTRTLIDDYLAEQQKLQTPVRRFSDAHDRAPGGGLDPVWRDSIPLSKPAAGEQYAFEVDVDRCTGCKACVAGCHSLNGLDEEETWRDVGLVLGGTRSQPFQQTITTACHHCADPACLNGCPVLAYEKDPVTGIVRHLDDQCIGCQYCVMKCPYDVPKYSERLGIVRKCDMCHSRLNAGEAPACVQACPTQAIRIVAVKIETFSGTPQADTSSFLTVAPAPHYTQPTTRYLSKRALPANAAAADAAALRPQPPHWPLVFMLTLMPMSVGALAFFSIESQPRSGLVAIGWLAGAAGLAASVFHLGQPLRAWRIFLGVRKSWLSREAMGFGIWFASLSWILGLDFTSNAGAPSPFVDATVGLGAFALFCSVMIYVDTRRSFWRWSQTLPRFFGSAIVLGGGATFALYPKPGYALTVAAGILIKLAIESRCFRALDDDDDDIPKPDLQTARILAGPLRPVTAFRYLTALTVLVTMLVSLQAELLFPLRLSIVALSFASELTERYLYFRAVFAPKMPGMAR